MVPKMCGMVPKMCGMVPIMCGMVPQMCVIGENLNQHFHDNAVCKTVKATLAIKTPWM